MTAPGSFAALRWLVSMSSGDARPPLIDAGAYPVIGAGGVMGHSTLSNAVSGHVAVGRVGTVGSIHLIRERVWMTDNVLHLRPSSRIEPRFLAYVLQSTDLKPLISTTAQPLLTGSLLGSVQIPVVSSSRQEQIADYLDAHTAKIDLLVEKQERLIETLTERRQAVISHAVTKGLDRNATMKESNVAWLGDVPGTWRVTQVKHLFEVTLGKMLDAGRSAKPGDEQLPYIRAGNIQEHGLDLSDVNTMAFTPTEQVSLSLKADDLLVVEGGAVGVCVVLDDAMPGWSFQKTVNRVRARDGHSTTFLSYFLDSIRVGGVLDMLCNKSTIAHFTAEKLKAVEMPLPSIEDQHAIVWHLDGETARIDALAAKAREMIDVLKERRQALISAAVTGKIDVRGLS